MCVADVHTMSEEYGGDSKYEYSHEIYFHVMKSFTCDPNENLDGRFITGPYYDKHYFSQDRSAYIFANVQSMSEQFRMDFGYAYFIGIYIFI